MTDAVEALDQEIGPRAQQRFVVVLRGYDRIEVDEALTRISGRMAALGQELNRAKEDARAAAQARPQEPVAAEAQPEGGFGVRAERLLRLAQQEADDMRSGAARDAASVVEAARAEAERLRHEMEQELITRSAALDVETTSRLAAITDGEQRVAEQIAAGRRDADGQRAAVQQEAEQLRERTVRDIEQMRRAAEQEVVRARKGADAELERIRGLDARARHDLRQLADLIVSQLGQARATVD